MGMDHLIKARVFNRERNWSQALRYSDLAATKLLQLKDRPIEEISKALELKCAALDFLGRYKEQLECAKEWYCLWNTKPTDMGAIDAAFALIQSCMNNQEFVDAHLYASTLWEIINHKHDNKIPDNQRHEYIAKGAYHFAEATLGLVGAEGIPPAEKQKAGQEAITLARKALEMYTEQLGNESETVANAKLVLAELLDCINDVDDDEVLRLFEQAISCHVRVFGRESVSVAISENKLGVGFYNRAMRAHPGSGVHREQTNLQLSLTHLRESARIFRAIGRIDMVGHAAQIVVRVEDQLRRLAAATTTTTESKG